MTGKIKGVVVGATQSGAGKTTVSLALMAALRRRGYTVQAYKVGPDFIDPGHHAWVTGRASHNLDGWMLSRQTNMDIFNRYAAGSQVVVVEGVMGLYDGYDGNSEAGSTAQMAKWLGLPVLLCVDARSMARSMAAVVLGFSSFDPDLSWAGVVANRVGSPRHLEFLSQAVNGLGKMPLAGGLGREESIALPERHLGLVTADERCGGDQEVERLADWFEAGVNLDRLWDSLPELSVTPPPEGTAAPRARVRLGVARDEAFCFYYQENLRLLQEAGAELVFFSPMRDPQLPVGLDGLYIGGGYPELFARELSGNYGMRSSIRGFGLSGKPIYGECGGFMYLGKALGDLNQCSWPMTGLLPVEFRMLEKLRALGYREVGTTEPTPLGPSGLRARGHEFHYSEIARLEPCHKVYSCTDRNGSGREAQGYLMGNVLGSYVHLHFGSNPLLAAGFVEFCRTEADRCLI
jgi:cobyrinic acid a,c-diamide synthase